MGDPGGDYVPWRKGSYVFRHTALLGSPAGEGGQISARPVLLHPGDREAHRPVHPGEDGNVPDRALPDAQGPLLPGDNSPDAGQIQNQIVGAVAQGSPGLQDSALAGSLCQSGRRAGGGNVLWGMEQVAFGEKLHGLHIPFSLGNGVRPGFV